MKRLLFPMIICMCCIIAAAQAWRVISRDLINGHHLVGPIIIKTLEQINAWQRQSNIEWRKRLEESNRTYINVLENINTLNKSKVTKGVCGQNGVPRFYISEKLLSSLRTKEDWYDMGKKSYLDSDIDNAISCWNRSAQLGSAMANWELYCIFQNDELRRDTIKAYNYLCQAAKLGQVEALMMMGKYYDNGYIVRKNIDTAISYYKEAAKKGDPTAYLNLYDIYQNDVLRRDTITAYMYLCHAAQLGQVEALTMMGTYYDSGYIVQKDIGTAISYYKEAAKKDEPTACYSLYAIYQTDELHRDTVAAFEYLRRAAELGHPMALHDMGACYQEGYMVDKNVGKAIEYYNAAINEQDIAETYTNLYLIYQTAEEYRDTVAAFEYLRRAAELGNPLALNDMGTCYQEGYMVDKNIGKAIDYYKAAIEKRDVLVAYTNLYSIYKTDEEHKDSVAAFKYLCKAAELGDAMALHNMGTYYQNGYMVEKNIDKAIDYYNAALDREFIAESYWNLYIIYQFDEEHRNIKAAFGCLKSAANNLSYPDALNNLGYYYEVGYMVDKNILQALGYYNSAAEGGCDLGYANLGRVLLNKKNKKVKQYKPELAVTILQMGAERGNPESQYLLGMAYDKGHGINKDKTKAAYWLNLAASNGIKSKKDIEKGTIPKQWLKEAKHIKMFKAENR